jgi:hypothetical protein
MQRERKLRALRRAADEAGFLKGDELVLHCPRCKHRKLKLSVNLVTDNFHCWVCGFAAKSLAPLLRSPRTEDEFREYVAESQTARHEPAPERVYEIPILPDEFRSLTLPPNDIGGFGAMKYLTGRGLTVDDIVRWKLGYCGSGRYRGRVIVPTFDEDGELNFFEGRGFYPSVYPRYSHGEFSKDIVANDYTIDWDSPVVIVEGPFDAIKAGENAIPLFGSELNEGSLLFRKIVTSGVDVYLALDADAFEKQLGIITSFMEHGTLCHHVPLLGRKDVGEMSHDEFLAARGQAVPLGSMTDLIRLRING